LSRVYYDDAEVEEEPKRKKLKKKR